MKLNNSIKLSIANFNLFWKILVYKVIAIGIILLLLLPLIGQIHTYLTNASFYNNLSELFNCAIFQGVSVILERIYTTFNSVGMAVSEFATSNTFGFIYTIFVLLLVTPYLLLLSDVPASESMYSYMTSLNKNSFTVNFVDNLGKSSSYSLLKVVIEVPFWALFTAGFYGLLSLSRISIEMQIVLPILMFIYLTFFVALNMTAISGWAPSIVAFNKGAACSFKKGIKSVSRNFTSTLSSFSVVTICMYALFLIFGLYSIVVVFPLMALINAVFGQVLFFESQGMDYYISPENIVKTRKLEQADSIKKVKYKI